MLACRHETPDPSICTFLGVALLAASVSAAAADAWPELIEPGTIVLFRHANAPGVGDPTNFKLNDCTTQRNLDDRGRAEACRLGERFRSRKIKVDAVLTSQWCRGRETARLAFGDLATDEPAFNSFFSRSAGISDAQTAQARAILSRWRGPGALVVVTHQVNITALTGGYAASAEGVVLRPAADGSLKVLGRVTP
ncbi:MAG: histidine phosphatase family protein [Pseudomonadota bacterium]|uniref:histidine phosphatase family protein n=1 Tax=Polaromonas sp. TaxID=1869339 RepID=UPI0025EB868E|nr:histidine phosphatase family protein [Polaromonas sp.]MDQ3271391.1 histidine phosphatase family protein [Pseudomonadota bacterium]